ncbi:hypothetical protein L3Q82_013316, partial [Scortum barcoo]
RKKLTSYKLKEWAAFQWSCSSAVSTVTLPNRTHKSSSLTAVAQAQQDESLEAPGGTLPANCREEMYPCTRMYSVHRPIKRCIGALCFYSLPRVYVINKEICMRTVCQQDEYLK